MTRKFVLPSVFILAALFLLIFSCSDRETPEGDVVAQVGEYTLTKEQLMNRIPTHADSTIKSNKKIQNYLDEWIKDKVIYLQAEAEDYREKPKIKKKIRKEVENILVNSYTKDKIDVNVSEQEMERYYERNKEKFVNTSKKYKASYILVPTKEEAEKIEELLDEGAAFDSLAKKHSQAPSADSGGNLGYFSKTEVIKPISKRLNDINVGEIAGPLETEFGYHIVKLTDVKEEGVPLPYKQVKRKIHRILYPKKYNRKLDSLCKKLRTNYDIKINLNKINSLE